VTATHPATCARTTRPGCCASWAFCSSRTSSISAPISVRWAPRRTCWSQALFSFTSWVRRGCALLEIFPAMNAMRHPEMDVGVAVRLCRHRACCQRALGTGRLRHVCPKLQVQKDYIVTIVAVLGTTITPYCFFWQSSEEAEEQRIDPPPTLCEGATGGSNRDPAHPDRHLGWHGFQPYQLVHHHHHRRDADASGITIFRPRLRRRRLSGDRGGVHLCDLRAGIIGIGLLAVPVLAGSRPTPRRGARLAHRARPAAAGCQAFYARSSSDVDRRVHQLHHLDPIKALFWSAVVNGVIAVPLMIMIMIMAMQKKVMGAFTCRVRFGRWVGCARAMAVAWSSCS